MCHSVEATAEASAYGSVPVSKTIHSFIQPTPQEERSGRGSAKERHPELSAFSFYVELLVLRRRPRAMRYDGQQPEAEAS